MRETWERRIRRAEQLAADGQPTASLLAFYSRLLRQQRAVYDSLADRRLSGAIEEDAALIAAGAASVLEEVAAHGPAPLVAEARALLGCEAAAIRAMIVDYWLTRSDRRFFAKTLLQPYAQRCAEGAVNVSRLAGGSGSASLSGERCPRCGGAPQVSVLEVAGGESSDGGSRTLLCATCLTSWPCRRVLCPACGEEDERRLGYFRSPILDHVRVDACETCRRYLKTVDRGRLGLAVPLVDEVAGAPLDVWAQERGYAKIELNLVGL